MNNKSVVLNFAALMLVAFVVTACGGGGGDGGGGGGESLVPTKLSFVMHPSIEESEGVPFSFFSIEIQNQDGSRADTYSGEVLVTLSSGSGTLLGTLLKVTTTGYVCFDDLSYDQQETIAITLSSIGLNDVAATITILPSDYIPSGLLIERVSVSSAGTEGNGPSGDNTGTGQGGAPTLSHDGRYVAFTSIASNLADSDTNGTRDVFVRDRYSGITERVSLDPSGSQASFGSYDPVVSANGRFVAFRGGDLLINDRHMNEMLSPPGNTQNVFSRLSLSGNNRYVSFKNHFRDMFTSAETLVTKASDGTPGNGTSSGLMFSAAGRFIVFDSLATNLVADDTNGMKDIFVYDRDTDENGIFDEVGETLITRVSVSTAGTQGNGYSSGPAISRNGRYVTFVSSASNLVQGSTNWQHTFVRDRDTDNDGVFDEPGAVETLQVSVSSGGVQANGASWGVAISGDGRYISFASYASNLITGDNLSDYDIFVHDIITAQTAVASAASDGIKGNGNSSAYSGPSISADGRYIAFQSSSTNLVSGDNNGWTDVFVAPNPLYQ